MTVTLTTREAIARAAGQLFERHGYTGTSVRAVAAEAGVDPALVIRHFGSKEKLFLDTMDLQGHFGGVAQGNCPREARISLRVPHSTNSMAQ